MASPLANGSGPNVNLGTLTDPMSGDPGLTNALGNAAQQCARKGAMASDPSAAKDYGAAALSYVQALMALIAPKVPQATAPGPEKPGQGQLQDHMGKMSQALSDLARREPAQVHVHAPQRKGLKIERDESGNAVAYRVEE